MVFLGEHCSLLGNLGIEIRSPSTILTGKLSEDGIVGLEILFYLGIEVTD